MSQGRPEPAGRTALITGAGTGIGRAVALALARGGARLGLVGRRSEPLQRVATEIASLDGEAVPIPGDVTDDRQLDATLGMATAALGPIEILVNNAGVGYSAPLEKTSDEDIDRLMALHVRAPFAVARRVVPAMVEAGWGRIVNVASTASVRGSRYTTLYTATKHALGGLTRSLAAELLPHGITVNAICPGYVDTAIVESAARLIAEKTDRDEREAREGLSAINPLGRLVTPEEVARAVLYVVGPDAVAVNGQSLVLDGGTQPV